MRLIPVIVFMGLLLQSFAQKHVPDSVFLHQDSTLLEIHTIKGNISPKSIGFNGVDKFFAQNMMYKHTITVYDQSFRLIKTIKDGVRMEEYGYDTYGNFNRGAPVEVTFTDSGNTAWVSNYQMFGDSLSNPGCDKCFSRSKYDPGFVYRINTDNYTIEQVIQVGSVPKYICATPDNKYVLVSNWSSGDVSIIDTDKNEEVKRIYLGRFPRGIAIDSESNYAYVAIMGSTQVAKIDLQHFKVDRIKNVGKMPRHLCISPDNKYLYASINHEGKVVKIDLDKEKVSDACYTGTHPRSMALSKDGRFAYVVNYYSNKMSKIQCSDMHVVEEHKTHSKPIGITVDTITNNVWVACYTGRIQVFHDKDYYSGDPMKYVRMPTPKKEPIGFQALLKKIEDAELAYIESESGKNEAYASTLAMTNEPPKEKSPAKPETTTLTPKDKPTPKPAPVVKPKPKPAPKPVEKPKPPVKKNVPTIEKPVIETNSKNATYHIIAGSFGVQSNAIRLKGKYEKEGYSVVILKKSNGLNVVSIYQSDSEENANRALKKIKASVLQQAWVYKLES